ncbi:MAG: haloalkane dehalogenase [Rhodothermia bacterium]
MTQRISSAVPLNSSYVEVDGSRIHFVEAGAGDPILFLHGNPTSSYLWRNIIPHLTSQGRCLAPDLIGMGRSDRPDIEYRFFDHVKYVEGFIEALGLKNLVLVIHDWGSALGFHYATRHENNVRGIAFMEAFVMPFPDWGTFGEGLRELFQAFRKPELGRRLIVDKNLFVEQVLPGGVMRELGDEEMRRYREPFEDPGSREPIWRWPNEIPIGGDPADVHEAFSSFNTWLRQSDTPKLLFHATPGAILPVSLVDWCRRNIKGLNTVDIGPGIHFLQEDNPHLIGEELASWYATL